MNCANRDIDHLVECAATAGPSQFSALRHPHLSLNTTGMSTTLSKEERDATVGSRLSPTPAHELRTCNERRSPCQCTATGESHGNLHLRHDRGVDDMPGKLRTWRCTITGMSTWSKNCPRSTCRCTPTGMSTTVSENCTCRRNNGHISTVSKNCSFHRNNGRVTTWSKNCNCGTPRAALSGP